MGHWWPLYPFLLGVVLLTMLRKHLSKLYSSIIGYIRYWAIWSFIQYWLISFRLWCRHMEPSYYLKVANLWLFVCRFWREVSWLVSDHKQWMNSRFPLKHENELRLFRYCQPCKPIAIGPQLWELGPFQRFLFGSLRRLGDEKRMSRSRNRENYFYIAIFPGQGHE